MSEKDQTLELASPVTASDCNGRSTGNYTMATTWSKRSTRDAELDAANDTKADNATDSKSKADSATDSKSKADNDTDSKSKADNATDSKSKADNDSDGAVVNNNTNAAMPACVAIHPSVLKLQDEMIGWRRHLHAHPELAFQEVETARYVANLLRSFDIEVFERVGRTGVVGILRGKKRRNHNSNSTGSTDSTDSTQSKSSAEASSGNSNVNGKGDGSTDKDFELSSKNDTDADHDKGDDNSDSDGNGNSNGNDDGIGNGNGNDDGIGNGNGDSGGIGIDIGDGTGSDTDSTFCIALRADMDGLPVGEVDSKRNREFGYKSTNNGVMHAARILSAGARELDERVVIKFIFQPAEEGLAGAKAMIDDGVLQEGKAGPLVNEIYGIHLFNYLPFSHIGVKYGPLMAASDRFTIAVKGKGGHGAVPDSSVDAIVAASSLVSQLQTIVSRNISPLDSGVVTVGTINGGYASNVIADHVELTGTCRSFSKRTQALIVKRMQSIVTGVSNSYDVEATLDYRYGYPCTDNTSALHVECVRRAAAAVVPMHHIIDHPGTMCAEDFSYYLEETDGCFFFVGSGFQDEETLPHHKSCFDFDERSMSVGASIFLHIVDDAVKKHLVRAGIEP